MWEAPGFDIRYQEKSLRDSEQRHETKSHSPVTFPPVDAAAAAAATQSYSNSPGEMKKSMPAELGVWLAIGLPNGRKAVSWMPSTPHKPGMVEHACDAST